MADRPWLKNYDPGVPRTLDLPKVPLFRFLEDAAAKHPDVPCTIFKGAKITYREMDGYTNALAAALVEMGVKRGQPVAMFMPNTPQFVMCFYGILKAGGVVVATNPLYTPREIEHQMKDAGAEIMILTSNFYSRIKEVQPATKLKKLIVTNIKETLPPLLRVLFTLAKEKKEGHRVELAAGDMWLKDLLAKYAGAAKPKIAIGPEDLCIFQYSGGTTGVSKAAVSTHMALLSDTLAIRAWMPDLREGQELMLMAIPLFHVYGMVAGMSVAVAGAMPMVMVPNPRDLHDLLGSIQKYRPTIFPGVPTLYNAINNHPDVRAGKYKMDSIRACVSGSAPLMRETKETFERLSGGKLVEGYGLSEAPTATHVNPLKGRNITGSIGLPLPGVDARIVSLDDGVTVLPVGEVGELSIRGPMLMKGYHNMPTETANTLRDGWLFTGDIARMDDDGYFYIVDRKKELIKVGGYQVWPREVEEVLSGHPKVLEAAAAGIPDAYRGETVKAWVVLKPGQAATEDELKTWCTDKLAKFKIPSSIEFRSEPLPKTTVGKILRRELVREHKEKSPAK
ncbi:MAG TPA: long-chain fatty acid--CoA ligase [Anaerolineales bacterium]|nr:long-chain fatty acid--CoA ligase [Anaerolineales bacterium]